MQKNLINAGKLRIDSSSNLIASAFYPPKSKKKQKIGECAFNSEKFYQYRKIQKILNRVRKPIIHSQISTFDVFADL
jgi:hypothetical protein